MVTCTDESFNEAENQPSAGAAGVWSTFEEAGLTTIQEAFKRFEILRVARLIPPGKPAKALDPILSTKISRRQ
jgi:hypothetical protein